jgi:hypothetical protein
MKIIIKILLIFLPVIAQAQSSLTYDILNARQVVNAPLVKMGNDSAATKAYARTLVNATKKALADTAHDLRDKVRVIKLMVTSSPQTITFDSPFTSTNYAISVNCYNSEGSVWYLITNRNEAGFTLITEINSSFECISIKK